MGLSVVTYALCKKYTDDTASQFGGLKGAPCKVKSVEKENGQSVITLEWKNDEGATQESYVYVNDGVTQWAPDRPYAIGDLVIYDNILYSCITPNNDHTFNPSKWTSISGGSAETDYYIVDLQSSIPVSFASTERKIYYCLEDSNFHLWDGTAWSIISSDIKKRELTQAQYDALTPAEKMNGTLYFVTDAETYTNIVEGYFNSADNLFYEENTYVTPIAGEHNTIYISIDINKSFRYDNLTEIFVRLDKEEGGGSTTLADLDDTNISASVHEGQILRMNNSGDWENVDMPSIPANTSDLVNDSNFVSDSNYVHTDNNYDATAKGIVDNITTNLNDKVDKVSGKGLSTNDYTNIDKNIVSNISVALTSKVDKVSGKDLSTNDYDNTSKNKLDNLVDIKSIGSGLNFDTSTGELTATGAAITIDDEIDSVSINPVQNKIIAAALNEKVNVEVGKGLSTNDYTDIDKNIVSNISIALTNKVDKIAGKDLSTNDYDNLSKSKLDNLVDIKSIGNGLNFNASTGELTATGAAITIDSVIDPTSVNPVQNMVIATALDGKVNTEAGKGLSTNDYTDIDKNIVSNISTALISKVDKIVGKGLSTNDYTDIDKNIVSNISTALTSKVDKVVGKDLSTNDYTDADKEIVAGVTDALDNKVDKVSGKGLSTNDYTDIDRNIVSNISTALSGKVDKVPGKGLSTEDYTTEDKTKLGTLENYDDTALSGRVSDIEDMIPSGASSSDQLAKISDIPDVSNFITNTVNNLVNYYTKSETYTKEEVNAAIGAISTISFDIESVLPTENIQTNVIYLIPKSTASTNNIYDEYINLNGTSAGWELIGTTEIDLSGYVTTSDLNTALADYVTDSDLNTILSNYVTSSDLNNYVTTSDLNTTLGNYVTDSDLNTTLGDYVTDTELGTTLNDYVTTSSLNTTLGDYVTDSELSTELSDYVETSDLTTALADYTPTSDLETTLGTSLIPNGGTTGQALVKNSNNNRDVTWSTISAGGGNPVGTVISFFGTTAPDGYLSCDGSWYNIDDYPALANHMSQFVGYITTTQFKVPDLRGEFLRGTGVNSHTNQGNGSSVGAHQDATEVVQFWADQYNFMIPYDSSSLTANLSNVTKADKFINYGSGSAGSKSVSSELKRIATTTAQSAEVKSYTAKPTNTSVLYCIKY